MTLKTIGTGTLEIKLVAGGEIVVLKFVHVFEDREKATGV